MLKNYLKIAVRNIFRHKGYSFINITGLAIGMTCAILIFLWVQDEFGYDRFHENVDELYKAMVNQKYVSNVISAVSTTPGALGPALQREYPEIVNSGRTSSIGKVLLRYDNKILYENRFGLVDPSIFEIFTFPFVKGDPKKALSDPHSIVITEEIAKKYFDNREPLGKAIKLNNQYNFIVTGVIENIPLNSSIRYNFFVPLVFLKELGREIDQWRNDDYETYILLKRNTSYEHINKKIAGRLQKEIETKAEVYLYPFNQYHLDVKNDGVAFLFSMVLSIIAILILSVSCINFINLSTARSANRAREIGLRKVVGANRVQLIKQFFGESFFTAFIAGIIAVNMVLLILPSFNNLSRKQLTIDFSDFNIVIGLIIIIIISGLLSGSYPALFLSSFKSVSVLKGILMSGSKRSLFRKILVIVQFSVSIILILATIVTYRQLDYILDKDLGFDKENVIYISLKGDFLKKYESVKNKLLQNPGILNITRGAELPTLINSSSRGWEWDGKDTDEKIFMSEASVGFDYIETFNMKMARGRFYSRKFSTDKTEAIIINEEAVRFMGMESPLGKQISKDGINHTIIGVAKDYHYKPIFFSIKPLIIRFNPGREDYMFIRINPKNALKVIAYLEEVHKTFNPDYPFEYGYVDEENLLFRGLQPIGQIIFIFTLLAIFISCMGLFGLTSFTIEQKTREIGIRKVLGASVSNIVQILFKEFARCILTSNIIAWPIAYFIMTQFLNMFAFRINISLFIFISAGLLVLFIAFLTVSYQSVRAAIANPVESLRYE